MTPGAHIRVLSIAVSEVALEKRQQWCGCRAQPPCLLKGPPVVTKAAFQQARRRVLGGAKAGRR